MCQGKTTKPSPVHLREPYLSVAGEQPFGRSFLRFGAFGALGFPCFDKYSSLGDPSIEFTSYMKQVLFGLACSRRRQAFGALAFTDTAGKRCADGDGGSAIAGKGLVS